MQPHTGQRCGAGRNLCAARHSTQCRKRSSLQQAPDMGLSQEGAGCVSPPLCAISLIVCSMSCASSWAPTHKAWERTS